MIGVDTNILLRYIVRDDEEQFQKVSAFLAERRKDDPAYVSFVVLAEMIWTLRRHYGYPNGRLIELMIALVEARELAFEFEPELSALLTGNEINNTDIADHLIALTAAKSGCSKVKTFDQRAAKSVPGMELLA